MSDNRIWITVSIEKGDGGLVDLARKDVEFPSGTYLRHFYVYATTTASEGQTNEHRPVMDFEFSL